MRFIGMLVLGVAIGWFARDLTFDKSTQRAERKASNRDADVPDGEQVSRPEPKDTPARDVEGEAPDNAAPEPDATDKPRQDPLRAAVKTMARQWKAMSSMFSKQRGWQAQLLALGFDAETAQRIEKLIGDEASRQTEKAVEMMLDGDVELDPEVFYWFMGVGPKLSTEAERDFALFLSEGELASVRKEIHDAHVTQLRDYANMTMGQMGIPDLSDDQKTQMRAVLAGKDFIREQIVGFAQLTRDRKKLLHVLNNPEDMAKEITERMKPMRRRMQSILRPDQFTQYTQFEKGMIQLSQLQMKMVGGMLTMSETKTPDGK